MNRLPSLNPAPLLAALVVVMVLGGLPAPPAGAQERTSPDGVWTEGDPGAGLGPAAASVAGPLASYRVYQIDAQALAGILARAPRDGLAAAPGDRVLFTLPLHDGAWARFEIAESPVFSPELAAANPDIMAFAGQGVDDPTLSARFVTTPAGFYAFIRTLDGMVFMEPLSPGDTERSVLYSRRDLVEGVPFECLVPGEESAGGDSRNGGPGAAPGPGGLVAPSGATLSTYDLAVTATGEFTTFFDPGGGTTNTLAQIAASVAAVNAIYIPEVAIRFTVVCNNVFTDPDTDPFTDSDNSSPSLDQNQTSTDANCGGSGGYDIGHVFHRRSGGGFSGLAGGNTCNNANKARGYSSVNNPVPGTMIWIVDQLCHEMGHQFTAAHTFNSDVTGCSGNRVGSSAYEPGSGSTVMSYAAGTRCDYDFPGSNDAYFHGHSFDQITNHRDGGGACGATSATGNTPPAVNAGSDFTIPQGTPFILTASGSDADGHALTYCWEQFDLGSPGDVATNVNGPLFRSLSPTASASRTLPAMADILAGNPTPTEILPLVDRTLNFRCSVRDNRAFGGGVNNDAMVVTVSGSPFFVTSPDGGETRGAGAPTTVTWTVGGGSVAALVDVRYSTDGGASFTTLAAGVPNDGSQQVTIPCGVTNDARILVRAVGNIFFDVSDGDFSVVANSPSITVNATDGPVDGDCEYTVPFGATVTDDGGVSAADVSVNVALLTANATLGAPTVNKVQVDATTVTVTGSVLVSDLTGSPATVRVTVGATDNCGASDSESADADVSDVTPPVITCPTPDPFVVECTAIGGTPADDPQLIPFFAGVSATDNCDPDPDITNDAPAFFPHGDTVVTFTATDASGNATPCMVTVSVVDTTPPEISVVLSRYELWPPNHKMSEITATVEVTDICDPNPTWVLTSIVSDEPDNGLGDGDTADDIQDADFGTDDAVFSLRSERSGLGDGRCYTVVFTASDASGNTADSILCVSVPHDRSGAAIASAGYLPSGSWVDSNAETFTVIVPSDAGLDPATIDVRRAMVGNSQAVLGPRYTQLVDLTGDGLRELALTYPTAGLRALRTLSSKQDPIGLHFRDGDGVDYLVPDIFAVGKPILFEDLLTGGLDAVDDLSAGELDGDVTLGGVDPRIDVVPQDGAVRPTLLTVVSPGHVTVEVFDVRGRRLDVLVDDYLNAGEHVLAWDGRIDGGRPAPNGVYFYRIQGPGLLESRRVVWIR